MGIKRCPVCQSVNLVPLFTAGEFRYMKCRACGLVFLSNVPSDKYFKKFYAYEKNFDTEINRLNPVLQTFLKLPIMKSMTVLLGQMINVSRAKSIKKIRKSPKILDVGCGPGDFLSEAKKLGWDTYGLELGDRLVNLTESKIGRGKVFKGYLDKIDFGKKKFDVITIWHVLEHMLELEKTFRKINVILSKEGTLVIEVPHSGSLNLKIFNKNWTLLLAPQHLHFWSEDSFKKLLHSYGLIIKRTEYPNHFPLIFFSSLVKKHRWLIYLAPILLPLSATISFCFSILKKGNLIRIYAIKEQ